MTEGRALRLWRERRDQSAGEWLLSHYDRMILLLAYRVPLRLDYMEVGDRMDKKGGLLMLSHWTPRNVGLLLGSVAVLAAGLYWTSSGLRMEMWPPAGLGRVLLGCIAWMCGWAGLTDGSNWDRR